MEQICFNKPVQTLNGKYVTIYTTEGPDEKWPIVGCVEGSKTVRSWNSEGMPKTGGEKYVLIQAPDYESYTLNITEGENNRGKIIAHVVVDPSSSSIDVKMKEGWTLKGVPKPEKIRPEQKDKEPSRGSIATAGYLSVIEEMSRGH